MDIFMLEARYLDSCRRNEVLPNSEVMSWFSKAKIQKSCREKCSFVVHLNQLMDADISPLISVFHDIDSSDFGAVDMIHESPCNLSQKYIMPLLRLINPKLQVVDLRDMSLEEDILRGICDVGLACHTLNLRSAHIQKLNMTGRFLRLHSLNLDFCTSITSLDKDCFYCMPNLTSLSMCETRVANLWATTASLSKLRSLRELRFQSCLCCKDTGPCPASFGEKADVVDESLCSVQLEKCLSNKATIISPREFQADEACGDFLSPTNSYMIRELCQGIDDLSDISEIKKVGLLEVTSNVLYKSNGEEKLQNEIQDREDMLPNVHKLDFKRGATKLETYILHHPSPICFEKHYREYMIASLPHLEVLDNSPISMMDREMSKSVFSEFYEYLPYKRSRKESVASIVQKREIGLSGIYCPSFLKSKREFPCGKGQGFFPRSLSAAKLGSAAWPLLHPLSSLSHMYKGGGSKRLRARQFEYHQADCSLMAFGTLDGEVVVINHENGKIVGCVPAVGAMNSVLGLCWLKKYPSKLLAGSDNGCLKLFDINHIPPKVTDFSRHAGVVTFDDFEQLTSVHVNSTDEQFLASGYSKDVALYDINSGTRLQKFTNLHREPINVAKFANHSPFLFATSSFDRHVKLWDLRQKPEQPCYTASSSRGNVMVCFSPNDLYLLVSAVDNEVKQLLAADGRLHMDFQIASTGSAHNYTRSYYMNGGDYIISGSCDENVVRICCTQTGRRLRDVYLEDSESGNPLFVQSLRGDPFRLALQVLTLYMERMSCKPISHEYLDNFQASRRQVGDHAGQFARFQPWRQIMSRLLDVHASCPGVRPI